MGGDDVPAVVPKVYEKIMKKLTKYVISGGLAAFVSVATLYISTEFFRVWYLVSTAIGFALSVFVSFSLQKFWTFEDSRTNDIGIQFTVYFAAMVIALIINMILVFVFVEYVKMWYVLAQIIAALFVACFNFVFYQFVLFKKPI